MMGFLCSLCSWIALSTVLGAFFIFLAQRSGSPVKFAGVYAQPGKLYYIKLVAFYLLMKIRKWKDARDKSKIKDHTNLATYDSGYGTTSKNSPEEMDKIQPLSAHIKAIDAVYFNGANKDGFYIVAATARRSHGVVDGFFIFTIPGIGTLVSPKFPDTLLFGAGNEYYGSEGFRFEPVTPMKHWKLRYNGELKLESDPSKRFKVDFVADWKTNLPYFDYDSMIPAWTMAKAFAKESWSRQYFQNLKEAHQTHYEQHGNMIGKIRVDDQTYSFDIPSMRDHSYGFKREWKYLHRYMFHAWNTVDGRRFGTIVVSQPKTSSFLELGYMYEKDGTMHPVEAIDLPLWNQGENGTPPTDYGYTFRANGKVHYVQVQVLETQNFHIGWEWEARIVERHCRFWVDGVEGFGVSECQYNHKDGRPEDFAASDPDWAKDFRKEIFSS
jgi:hypothetical protein